MDSTSEFRLKQSKHPYEQCEQFFSFNEQIQFTDSAQQQFQTFVKQIDPYPLVPSQDSIITKISNILGKWNNKSDSQTLIQSKNTQGNNNPKTFGIQKQSGNFQKDYSERHSTKDTSQKNNKQFLNNQNKVSLLQNSLKVDESINFSKNNSNLEISPDKANLKSLNGIIHNSSQKSSSKLAQKFSEMPPSPKQDSNKSNSIKNYNQSESNRNKNLKIFRIQGPDQVYAQLELEKQDKIDKPKANKIVENKINNTKAMLGEISIKNPTQKQIIQTPNKKYKETINQNYSATNEKFQSLISACLFRLNITHSSSNLPIAQNLNNTPKDQGYYHKYKYQLTQNQLIINNLYIISYFSIKKIKIIHNEYNRPQIKISYILDGDNNQFRTSKQSQLYNTRQSVIGMEKDGQNEGLVVYLCQCYEVVYSIYAWIVVSKVKLCMGKQIQQIRPKQIKIDYKISFDYQIAGILLKKSKFLKNWDKRYGKIENFMLKSYRITPNSPNKLKPIPTSIQPNSDLISNYVISSDSTFQVNHIKQLWTRFEILQNKYLIMKMFKKNKMQKIQIAIPIGNYCDLNSKQNWMLGLFGLLKSES